MAVHNIDINCDIGEGVGNEELLFPFVSSCNIACDGHAGDEISMRKMVKLAMNENIKIGAHPSYPDKENFGRISIKMTKTDLQESIISQLNALSAIVNKERGKLHHIKPHGALYNDLVKDETLVISFLEAIEVYKKQVFVYVPYTSMIATKALENGFKIKYEAFADRRYNTDLSLVSRLKANAVINVPENVLNQVISMVKKGQVTTVTDNVVNIKANTFCVHGDTATAVDIVTHLYNELPKHGISIRK